jgi:uracil-DNA glycosylase
LIEPKEPTADLGDLLRFYADAGVDEALDEVAPNRFQDSAAKKAQGAGKVESPAEKPNASQPQLTQPERPRANSPEMADAPPAARPQVAAVPDGAQAALAREVASRAGSLAELREIMAAFDGCNLKFTAKNLVFADGNPEADLMLVGEAPGRDEDLEGLPFVGRSGQLLDRMLAAIGRDRSSAYIANVIPWRPPGNRDPSPMETEICRPFIERQIELANPKVLMTLGNPSSKLLLQTQTGIMRLRGNWGIHRTPSGLEIATMPTFHPAYLLRNPAHKELAWRDFLEVKAKLRSLG